MSIPATYVSTSSFTVDGEFDGEYPWGRRITVYQGVDGSARSYVISATYSASTDKVTIVIAHSVLTENLTSISRGPGDKKSLGIHYHTSNVDDAGYMPASKISEAQVNALLALIGVTTTTTTTSTSTSTTTT